MRPTRRGLRLVFVIALVTAGLVSTTPVALAGGTFTDDDGNIHEPYIEVLASTGITRGCNPPANTRYCPDRTVTRGQMAAFLQRALDLRIPAHDRFVDDDGSEFEDAVNSLEAAGISHGCSDDGPRFCPDATLTRGQMAAFLVRAFGLDDPGRGDWFTDDDGSIFEGDIDRLRQAGVTLGCNPPANTHFCPNQPIRRDEMASLLVRAMELDPAPAPPPSPAVAEIYDAAAIAGVDNGLSGMFVSRQTPGVHWFVIDHHAMSPSGYTVFAIDAVNEKLLWRGKFDTSGTGGAISSWSDIEDLTGVYRNGRWYLAVWDNGHDAVYEMAEPDLSLGQSLRSVSGIVPDKVITIANGVVGSGNVEGMAWSQAENAMYWVGPRGGDSDFNDNERDVWKATHWTLRPGGSEAGAEPVSHMVNRPVGQNAPNGAGALDISTDGNLMVIHGVAGTGDTVNNWVMIHRKSSGQTWAERLTAHQQLTTAESLRGLVAGENVAFDPTAQWVFSAGEGTPGSSWGKVIRLSAP
jgi:hypothetical protein